MSKMKPFPKKTRNKKRDFYRTAYTRTVHYKYNYHELRIRGMSHKEAMKAVSRSYFVL